MIVNQERKNEEDVNGTEMLNLHRLKSMANQDVTVTLVEDDEDENFFQGSGQDQ